MNSPSIFFALKSSRRRHLGLNGGRGQNSLGYKGRGAFFGVSQRAFRKWPLATTHSRKRPALVATSFSNRNPEVVAYESFDCSFLWFSDGKRDLRIPPPLKGKALGTRLTDTVLASRRGGGGGGLIKRGRLFKIINFRENSH